MNSFTDRWRQLDWDDIRLRIHSKTARDVERALAATHPTREDMMALLSPAASAFLEPLAQRSQQLTRQRFGNTVSFYVPLYLSNLCANDCTYCGFSMSNRMKRKTLDDDEIGLHLLEDLPRREARIVRVEGDLRLLHAHRGGFRVIHPADHLVVVRELQDRVPLALRVVVDDAPVHHPRLAVPDRLPLGTCDLLGRAASRDELTQKDSSQRDIP